MISKRNLLLALSIITIFTLAFPVSTEGFSDNMTSQDKVVTYETFGAVGDGVHDDLPAVCKAHEYANAHGLCVKSKPGATYHLGKKALTAVITTDTDWSTSRFTIDDTQVDNHKKSLFEVRSLLGRKNIKISRLKRDQKKMDIRPQHDLYVVVMDRKTKRYIRRGLNQNAGTAQRDCFILHRDGSIEGDIDWNYDKINHIETRPIDEKTLILRGGIFTTIANQMKQKTGYNYWSRNIKVTRSNTEVNGLTHYVIKETEVGHPYSGFINVSNCANITLRNCFATGHKTYKTIGAAGKPVSMGSYDYSVSSVVNFTMIGCRMEGINDRTRWGIIGTNFCKNILLEDCTLSRMDTHMGELLQVHLQGGTQSTDDDIGTDAFFDGDIAVGIVQPDVRGIVGCCFTDLAEGRSDNGWSGGLWCDVLLRRWRVSFRSRCGSGWLRGWIRNATVATGHQADSDNEDAAISKRGFVFHVYIFL